LLGIVHSMAHKTGAAYSGGHIVHGCANAMYLPKVIRFNAKDETANKRYCEIAKFIGLEPSVDALIDHINGLNKKLDIPSCIKDYDGGIIDEKEFFEKLSKVSELAVGDACTGSNPRQITPTQMEQLLTCCYNDTEVDF
ncbi:MAG: iron-containing alcohol dehydrogenase, partial [Oscillospiraceae bacterium]